MLRERLEPGIKLWYFEGVGLGEKTNNVHIVFVMLCNRNKVQRWEISRKR